MRGLWGLMALSGVMCACLTVTYALAQVPKAVAPRAVAAQKQAVQKKQMAPPAAVAVPAPPAAVAEVDLAPLLEQFKQQFRPILGAELHLIRSVCAPSEEQRRQIVRAAERTLEQAAKKFAEIQQEVMRGRARASNPDPREYIQEGLATVVKSHLTPEQFARYQAELEERAENRKQIAVRNIVARLDADLILSAEQRDQLCEALSSNWNDRWCQQLESLQYINQFFPNIPSDYVTPFLNKTQQELWKTIQRNNGQISFGFGFAGMQMGGDLFEEEKLDEAQDDGSNPQGGR
jgi:hypothetical protein